MKVHVHCDDPAASPVRAQINGTLIRSLRRVKWIVESVWLHLSAGNAKLMSAPFGRAKGGV